MTSCAFDMAGLPLQLRCQLCRETAANYVVKPDTVSPTTFRQVKWYFYLLPKPTKPVHLIWCQRRPGSPHLCLTRSPTLTCVFCPKPDARMVARSSRRVVTRKSVDGGRPSRSHAETSR